MSLAESVFGGWALLWPWAAVAAVLAALLAVPSAALARFGSKPSVIAWLSAVAVTTGLTAYWWVTSPLDGVERWSFAVQFLLALVLPQLLSYPLARRHPWRRPVVAAGVVGVALAVWWFLAILSGATPD